MKFCSKTFLRTFLFCLNLKKNVFYFFCLSFFRISHIFLFSHLFEGGEAYESIIRREFEILKDLLTQREEQLIDEMKHKIHGKITELIKLDHDILFVLQSCQTSKILAQKQLKTNEQPRMTRSSWRNMKGRKKKVVKIIEQCIHDQIEQNSNVFLSQLIHCTMKLHHMLSSLPQPSHMITHGKHHKYPHHHRRHFEPINAYLLNIFTKNASQVHLEMSIPGFAFNYTFRSKMHEV